MLLIKVLASTILMIILTSQSPADAAPIAPGNVIISDPFYLGQSLLEYQPDGTLVQTIPVQQPGYSGSAGGITFDEQGLLWIFNGELEPYLSSWDSEADLWAHWSYPDWNSFLCFPCQGIGTYSDYVFITDMGSFGGPNGLVRFDRRDENFVRFADGTNYSALAVGMDGLVYARRSDDISPPPPTVIDVFDPTTLALVTSVTLSQRTLTMAADILGQLYGVSGQSVLRYSPDGTLLDSHQVIDEGALYTISLSEDDRFVVVSSNGEIVITDSKFVPQYRFWILTGSQAYAAIVPQESLVDTDGDGVTDNLDQCPNTRQGSAVNQDGCSVRQLVPCDGPLSGRWNNHGEYISTIVKTVKSFFAQDHISEEEVGAIVSRAARNDCGK